MPPAMAESSPDSVGGIGECGDELFGKLPPWTAESSMGSVGVDGIGAAVAGVGERRGAGRRRWCGGWVVEGLDAAVDGGVIDGFGGWDR